MPTANYTLASASGARFLFLAPVLPAGLPVRDSLVQRIEFRFGLGSTPGFAWVILSLTSVLLPQCQDKVNTYSQPVFFGEIAFMLCLVIKGAKPPALDAAASAG